MRGVDSDTGFTPTPNPSPHEHGGEGRQSAKLGGALLALRIWTPIPVRFWKLHQMKKMGNTRKRKEWHALSVPHVPLFCMRVPHKVPVA